MSGAVRRPGQFVDNGSPLGRSQRSQPAFQAAATAVSTTRVNHHLVELLAGRQPVGQAVAGLCRTLADGPIFCYALIATLDPRGEPVEIAQAGPADFLPHIRQRLQEHDWPVCWESATASGCGLTITSRCKACPQCPHPLTPSQNKLLLRLLRSGGRQVGLLATMLAPEAADEATADQFVEQLAGTLAAALGRTRAAERLTDAQARQALSASPDGLCVVDRESVITFANKPLAALLGFGVDEMVGRPLASFMPPRSAQWCRDELSRRRNRPRQRLELSSRTGEAVPVSVTISPIIDPSGRYDGSLVQVQTAVPPGPQEQADRQLREAEKALRDSQRLLELTVASLDEVVLVCEPGSRKILACNPAIERMFGYTQRELIGQTTQRLHVDAESYRRFGREYEQALGGGRSYRAEYHMRRRDGGVFATDHTVSLVLSDEGEPLGVVSIIRDVSDRQRVQAERAALADQLRQSQKTQALGRLAAYIAHEINNPLAGIKNAFLLVKEAIDPNHPDYHYVARIEGEVERIARIVRQMFDVYRPDQETPGTIDVAEVIADVVLLLEPACRASNVRCQVDRPADPLTATLARGSLVQVLFNVIQNAIKASPPGQAVTVRVIGDAERIGIEVADRGAGIPEQVQPHIFEPFFTRQTRHEGGGMGLGLPICRNLVESMSGSIEFTTSCEGTTFHILLPRQQGKDAR